ncbi:SLC13 family permease [Maricaulis sp. CAU 1757]
MITAFAGLLDTHSAWIALALVGLLLAAFITEAYPPEVIAAAGAAAFLTLGLVDTSTALAAFANPAPITIGALFVITGALLRTGILEAVSRRLIGLASTAPAAALASMFGGTFAASAFLNNTPVVMIMTPIARRLAEPLRTLPSKLLIPVSYAAILGGTCTLIGTSTNLLVDGLARDLGLPPFSLFEITGLGLGVGLVGGLYLLLAGPLMLPMRPSLSDTLERREQSRFIAEVVVPMNSALIGQPPRQAAPFRHPDVSLVDLLRDGRSFRAELDATRLRAGDRLVVETSAGELLGLRETLGRQSEIQPLSSRKLVIVEALVGPGRGLVGRTLADLDLPTRYGVFALALHRRGRNFGGGFEHEHLQVGDTVLFEGAPDAIAQLSARIDLLSLNQTAARPYRRRRAPVALLILAGIVLLAAFDIAPIAALALIGAALVLVTRCIDASEAMSSIDGRLLTLIFAMLIVGSGLEQSGAVELVIGQVAPGLAGAPPWLVLALVYGLTSVLTETVTNNAVAVIMVPLAAALAAQLGLDPRPFLVAVMFAASASFATPIGYQTNTLVYMAGGYRFADFLVIGLPMNIVVGIATILLTPRFWPLA